MRVSILIALLYLPALLMAQFGQGDSVMLVNGPAKLEPYQNRLKFDFGLDARRTFLRSQWIAVGGIRAGVQYRKIHRAGIGIYLLNTRLFSRDHGFPVAEELVEYDFGYTALYYQRALFFNRKWEIASSLQMGGGNVGVYYNPDGGNNRVKYTDLPFSTAELAVYCDYSILYWLGVGGGVGYRAVSNLGPEVNESFNGPIAVFNIQVKLFKLARSFFDPEVKNEF